MNLYTVYFYVGFPVYHRNIEKLLTESGVYLNHTTPSSLVGKYSGFVLKECIARKPP